MIAAEEEPEEVFEEELVRDSPFDDGVRVGLTAGCFVCAPGESPMASVLVSAVGSKVASRVGFRVGLRDGRFVG